MSIQLATLIVSCAVGVVTGFSLWSQHYAFTAYFDIVGHDVQELVNKLKVITERLDAAEGNVAGVVDDLKASARYAVKRKVCAACEKFVAAYETRADGKIVCNECKAKGK